MVSCRLQSHREAWTRGCHHPVDMRLLSPREIVISHHFASHVHLISMPVPVASKTTNYHHCLQVVIQPHLRPRMVLVCLFFASYQPPPSTQDSYDRLRLAVTHGLRPKEKADSPTKSFSLESGVWCYWQRELGDHSVRGRGCVPNGWHKATGSV